MHITYSVIKDIRFCCRLLYWIYLKLCLHLQVYYLFKCNLNKSNQNFYLANFFDKL